MDRLPDEIHCENCERQERGMSPTLEGWLACPHCRTGAASGRRGPLQRLFRIRRRRGADGAIAFERVE